MALQNLLVVVDSRLRLPAGLSRTFVAALKKTCSHANPDFHKKKAMGFATWGVSSTIATWEIHDAGTPAESLSLPRGAMQRLREVSAEHGFAPRFLDRRVRHPSVEWPPILFDPRWYQDLGIEACLKHEQGVVRAPTGSGKTLMAIALAAVVGQPTLVIMRDGNLLAQWHEQAVEKGGLHEREVGILKGGSRLRSGARLTLALQQTLYSGSFPLDEIAGRFGMVIVDEVHGVAARTFQGVISAFPARYRFGFSADECVARGTLITMGDESTRPVEDVEVGDVVLTPLGPRVVTAAMFKGFRETGVVEWIGGALRCTEDTWFAGPDGWYGQHGLSAVRFRDEQREIVPEVREADAGSLRRGVPRRVPADSVRAGRDVLDLRGDGVSSEGAERARADARWDAQGPREERGAPCSDLDVSEGRTSATCARADGGDACGGACSCEGDAARAVPGEAGDAVRREEVGQGEPAASKRACGAGCSRGSRVQDGRRGADGAPGAESLCARSGELRCEDRCGDRRFEPPCSGAPEGRRAENVEAPRLGVAGSSVLVDLRSLRASERGHRDARCESRWDGLTVPVYDLEIEGAACYYANGALVHNTRKDKKEFLVYDQFGRVLYEIDRETLETEGSITPVEVVLVPTEFRADWYRDAQGGERDFNALLDELIADPDRNALIVELVAMLSRRQAPSLVFSHRIEHARSLADVELFAAGVRCGLLLGGDEHRVRFAEDKLRLKLGDVPVCTGTFTAVGQGIDMPAVRSGVMATPVGNNRQFFGQVRGRICRPSEGKSLGRLFVIWDRHVFPDMPRRVESWNRGRTSVVELGDLLAAA